MLKTQNSISGVRAITIVLSAALIFAGYGYALSAEQVQTTKPKQAEKPKAAIKKLPPITGGRNVFRPREKISAGKPVSFPSDI
jgi:hypothetical protein